MKNLAYSKELPVRHETDVLVAGGGPSGCAAAWAAAKQGARVLLLEGHTCLGGLGTAGMVPAFMNVGDGERLLTAGFGTEVYRRLFPGMDLATGTFPDGGGLDIKAEELKRAYEQILDGAGAEYVYQSQLIDVRMDGQKAAYGIFAAKSGMYAVSAKIFVDCTGDGDLCVMAGAGYDQGDGEGYTMAGTLCSLWAGVDWEKVKPPDARQLEQAIEDGVFKIPDRSLPGMWRVSDSIGGGNVGHLFGVDGTDERSLTKGFKRGREYVLEYEKYYKEYLEGFENIELVATGSLLGIRESRRIKCVKTLEEQAFRTLAAYDDEIGRYCYSIDRHPRNNTKEEHEKTFADFSANHLKKGQSYGIPYGSIVPEGLDNVLVAGRCMGADRPMQGSMRVMPGCYITGQAAGAAAALCAKSGERPADLDVRTLQGALKDLGACLPNFKS